MTAPRNCNESPPTSRGAALAHRHGERHRAILQGSTLSVDGVYECRENRKAIFNCGMTPNIQENQRGRKTPKRGRRRHFHVIIFEERFRTIERVCACEDT
ncbi:hypothetical protein KDW41_25095 [Burkholderia vietnamiensis]|nr:hypothetical protein [Burkholderia vietnamiensis]